MGTFNPGDRARIIRSDNMPHLVGRECTIMEPEHRHTVLMGDEKVGFVTVEDGGFYHIRIDQYQLPMCAHESVLQKLDPPPPEMDYIPPSIREIFDKPKAPAKKPERVS